MNVLPLSMVLISALFFPLPVAAVSRNIRDVYIWTHFFRVILFSLNMNRSHLHAKVLKMQYFIEILTWLEPFQCLQEDSRMVACRFNTLNLTERMAICVKVSFRIWEIHFSHH